VNCYNANQAAAVQEFGAEFNSQNNSNELSPEDFAKQEAILKAILDAIMPWLPDFTKLLVDPPHMTPMKTTAGLLDPPLGQTRLNVAKLICALLGTNNKAINLKIRELETLKILLDLFFKYSLNNFLHAQVKECIRLVFAWNNSVLPLNNAPRSPPTVRVKTPPTVEMIDPQSEEEKIETKEETAEESADATAEKSADEEQKQEQVESTPEIDEKQETQEQKQDSEPEDQAYDNPLLVDLFTNCRLVERVLEAWEENESEEHRPGFHRKGYMGHLTNIANIMHQNMADQSPCQTLLDQLLSHYPEELRDKWNTFVENQLAEVNERNKIIPPSDYASKHDDEDADFKDALTSHESSTAQLYVDYQMQSMSENFVDTFGLSDAAFNDDNDDDSQEMRRLTNVLSEEDATATASDAIKRAQGIFEAICEQRFTSFPGAFDEDMKQEAEEDPWEGKTKEISFSGLNNAEKVNHDNNSSSDEDEPPKQTVSPPPTGSDLGPEVAGGEPETETKSSTVATIETNAKMEVDSDDDDAWASLNHRSDSSSEVIESGSGVEVAMDTGNPWDSKPLAASTTQPFDNPFDSPSQPKVDEGWANFSSKNEDSEMKAKKEIFPKEEPTEKTEEQKNSEHEEKVASPKKSSEAEESNQSSSVPMQ